MLDLLDVDQNVLVEVFRLLGSSMDGKGGEEEEETKEGVDKEEEEVDDDGGKDGE